MANTDTDGTVTGRADQIRTRLAQGHVIPALPLALNPQRRWDELHQKALLRYYLDAGAGGIAVGVHTTQFAIRDPACGLFQPLLQLASSLIHSHTTPPQQAPIAIGGVCGKTLQAIHEAELLAGLHFNACLLSLGAWREAPEDSLLAHCRTVSEIIPLIGFYLQPAVGGRILSYRFWRQFMEIPNVVAIKIAPFNRYQTLDVMRAVADSSRPDMPLYTGNDDHILLDLLTRTRYPSRQGPGHEIKVVGGLLGQWAVWTHNAVALHQECLRIQSSGSPIPPWLLQRAQELTDANGAIFDVANGFKGCIAGIHEILRRQGLMSSIHCLDPEEGLSPGQSEELDRVCRMYPHLTDDAFVRTNVDRWKE